MPGVDEGSQPRRRESSTRSDSSFLLAHGLTEDSPTVLGPSAVLQHTDGERNPAGSDTPEIRIIAERGFDLQNWLLKKIRYHGVFSRDDEVIPLLNRSLRCQHVTGKLPDSTGMTG